ncbi:Metallo-dependent hydrolase [Schizophyllum amplum]|uniref:Metallo-dependent hydrolase n=1 Tax=Schizophyllum amplum TaxID=97359 RepID=A0A550BZW4_9AGAR|nr:Metallo-dependent hydrolase [Auriculariopsis ampla]
MSSVAVAGPAKDALDALSPAQVDFIKRLSKAELHAHLNGSIPLHVLRSLALEYSEKVPESNNTSVSSSAIESGIQALQAGVNLDTIHSFFDLFPAIYALTSTPETVARTARAVLEDFLDGPEPQCAYLELRSTPRAVASSGMTRLAYVETVLDEVERYPPERAALIVSLDRRMSDADAEECVAVAKKLKAEGRRVVGVDLCGSPLAGDMAMFKKHFETAREAGLGITLHIAETPDNTREDTLELLSFKPNRLGHATFLDDETIHAVVQADTCIELCLSSNILCKTVTSLDAHHIRHYLKHDHRIAICTDDALPFRTNLVAEYALLLAPRPLGLGLSELEVARIAEMGMGGRFEA